MCQKNKQKDAGRRKGWNECDDHVIQRWLTTSRSLCDRNCVTSMLTAVPSLHWPSASCSTMFHFTDPGLVSVHTIVKERFMHRTVSEWSMALSLFKRWDCRCESQSGDACTSTLSLFFDWPDTGQVQILWWGQSSDSKRWTVMFVYVLCSLLGHGGQINGKKKNFRGLHQ